MLLFLKDIFYSYKLLRRHLSGSNCYYKTWLCTLCLLFIVPVIKAHAEEQELKTLHLLDKEFQTFSRDFFSNAVNSELFELKKYDSVIFLKEHVDKLISKNQPIYALSLIHKNISVLRDYIDAIQTVSLTEIMLNNNDWYGAVEVLDIAKLEAGKVAVSNLSFVFAKYFIIRKDWQRAYSYLKDIINDLSEEDANYARIMVGTILQHQKQHRKAVTFYKKVPQNSKHYPVAILNTAIAYLRQDWWTDAYIIIEDLIKQKNNNIHDHMIDRLNLVLGYALLRKEYFRNSRDVFRNIGLHSPYTNKALLGIALTAVNQEDFIGALNAVKFLKDKKTTDLVIDEAYLILPYVYSKLKQNLTATSAYTDAIKYYQERINSLNTLLVNDESLLENTSINTETSSIKVSANSFAYHTHYPSAFFNNYSLLLRFSKTGFNDKLLQAKYGTLLVKHKKTLAKISKHLLKERVSFLESYLNQARYGLARLYDSTQVSSK